MPLPVPSRFNAFIASSFDRLYLTLSTDIQSGKNSIYVLRVIIPSYLAKGLEFDSVLVYDASEKNYSESNYNLLYVVATRALHKLSLYYTGELCNIAKEAAAQAKEVVEM